MLKKSQLSIMIAIACTSHNPVLADDTSGQLAEIAVVEQENHDVSSLNINRKAIDLKQPRNIKDLFSNQLDVQVNELQKARSGNDGVNIRGLQGNRVAMNVDGVPLPETQENKLFVTLGMDFGRGNFVEPTALKTAQVTYGGSYQALSGSVNFMTLEPNDLYKNKPAGGFIATGYNSADNSTYGSVGGAVKNARYEGMLMTTVRFGDETKNNAENSTNEADPADYKNSYVLTKHSYQINDNNLLKLTFEHLQKKTDTDLLSGNGTTLSTVGGVQTAGYTDDTVRRSRVSFGHQYSSENGWVQNSNTQIYYQHALNDGYRKRTSANGSRTEESAVKDNTFGVLSDFTTILNHTVPQVLHYGFAFSYSDLTNRLNYITSSGIEKNNKPSADTKQTKMHFYLEDTIAWGEIVLTPHIGVLHYRSNPSMNNDYVQWGDDQVAVTAQHKTVFVPKFSLAWKAAPLFEPYAQYSRGVRTPSAQQLTSSYGNAFGRIAYAVVGNPNLRPETADNFELGFKGKNDSIQYRIAGYYNRYKNFIDARSRNVAGYLYFIQYQNLDNAKIYGVTADAKWHFYDSFNLFGGLAYARGKAEDDGVRTPINSIQPLKAKLGLGYEKAEYGANIELTHIRKKADKDINGSVYNPTRAVNLVDLGIYWKPIKDLTLTANINNLFDKKYWNWTDISYFAMMNTAGYTGDRTIAITESNADYYTAPGRNFNIGLRYEF